MADNTEDSTDKEIVDPKTREPRKKPVNDAKEALALAKRFFTDRKQANENHGKVRLKYDGEPPYKVGGFAAEGQSWRANTSRKSMSGAVQRSVPVLIQFLDGLRYLTASRLPDTVAKKQANNPTPQATADDGSNAFSDPVPLPNPSPQEKSEIYQRKITSLLRGWNGFRPFIYRIGNEDVLYGQGAAACLDDIEWRPGMFSFDQFAINSESSHDINECEAIAFKKSFAIHELIGFIEDEEAAREAGWDIENVVEAINNSLPDDKRRDGDYSRAKLYADMVRDGNYAQSVHADAKAVDCYVVPYREYTGKVSQYIVVRDCKKEDEAQLFYSEDRFERMADVCALFSLQEGSGKFYSSIGVGREVFGPHLARDRNYCRIADIAYLNGLLKLPDDKGNANRSAFRVDGLAMYLPGVAASDLSGLKGYDGNLSELIEVDSFLKNSIEELSNAYLPNNDAVSGEKATAREIIENARRIDMLTGDRLARFYGQFCALIEMVQRRACSRENIKAAKDFLEQETDGKTLLAADEMSFLKELHDKEEISQYVEHELPGHLDKEAVMLCVDLLREGLTPLDIYRLSRAPANEPMGDTPATMNQKIIQTYAQIAANPGVDQPALLKLFLSAALSPQLAEELALKVDPNADDALEQTQKQLIEVGTMAITGKPVDILPADNDAIHRAKLKELFGESPQDSQSIAANPQVHNALTLGLAHYNAHLKAGKAKGEKGEAYEQDFDAGQHMEKLLNGANEIVAKQQQMQSQQQVRPPTPPDAQ